MRPPATTSTKTPRSRLSDAESSQPWTASRCHRLLRQLESRVAALRKLVVPIDQQLEVARRPSKRTIAPEQKPGKKRTRYTYSSRKQKPASSYTDQTPSSTTTPSRSKRRLGTIRAVQVSPSCQDSFPSYRMPQTVDERNDNVSIQSNKTRVPRHLSQELQGFRDSGPDSKFRIYSGIFSWLCELLSSTDSKGSGKDAHKKSLLGMCLRKIPDCIDSIDKWDREMSQGKALSCMDNTASVSSEIYEQLEQLGTAGLGRHPLKEVVRAHGISLLKKAVAEGLFDTSYTALLVRLCIHFGGVEEAGCLVLAIPGPLPSPRSTQSSLTESKQLEPLSALLIATVDSQAKGRGAAFRCVSELLNEKRLPAAWICARAFSAILISAVESLSQEQCGPDAVSLLETTTKILASDNDDGFRDAQSAERQQALIRLAAGLATAPVSAINGGAALGCLHDTESQARLLLHTLDGCIKAIHSRRRNGDVIILWLARFLTEKQTGVVAPYGDAYRLLKGLICHMNGFENNTPQGPYRAILQLVCSVAQGRSRARGCLSHDCLIEVRDQLQDLELPRRLLDGLATDSAFLLAQKTQDLRDLAFAERQLHPTGMTTPTRSRTMFSGWEWEEGIGEWVMRSPADGIKVEKTASFHTRPGESAMVKVSQLHCRSSDTGAKMMDDDNGRKDEKKTYGSPGLRPKTRNPARGQATRQCNPTSVDHDITRVMGNNIGNARPGRVRASSIVRSSPHSRGRCNPVAGSDTDDDALIRKVSTDDGPTNSASAYDGDAGDVGDVREKGHMCSGGVQQGGQRMQQGENHRQGGHWSQPGRRHRSGTCSVALASSSARRREPYEYSYAVPGPSHASNDAGADWTGGDCDFEYPATATFGGGGPGAARIKQRRLLIARGRRASSK